jgi:hypothetical protein
LALDHALFVVFGFAGQSWADHARTAAVEAKDKEIAG